MRKQNLNGRKQSNRKRGLREQRPARVKTGKARRLDELIAFDCGELARMDNKTLAIWQCRFGSGEAGWILAKQERKRREDRPALMVQIALLKIAVVTAIISFLLLVLAVLNYWHPRQLTALPCQTLAADHPGRNGGQARTALDGPGAVSQCKTNEHIVKHKLEIDAIWQF